MRRLDGPVPFRGGGFHPRERWIAGAATLLRPHRVLAIRHLGRLPADVVPAIAGLDRA